MGADLIHYALTHKDTIQYVIAPIQEQAKIVFNSTHALAIKSRMVRELIETDKSFPFPEISFKNGSIIYARSIGNNQGKFLRGYKAHRIIEDEAEMISDDVENSVIGPLLADYDGDKLKIGTPFGRIGHFYEDYEAGLKGEDETMASFHFTSFDNPHVSHAYIERQRLKISDLQFRVEYLGEFVDDSVCVFKWQSISDGLRDYDESFVPEKGHTYYIGADLAKMHDYTCLVVIDATDQKACKVVYTERFTNKPYSFVMDRIRSIALQFGPVRILMDETGVGEGPTEILKAELSVVEGFKFSSQTKISLINTLKTGLEQHRILISANNRELINELRFYEYERSDSGNLKMNAPSGKFDDFVIALSLAYLKCSVSFADAAAFLINPPKQSIPSPLNRDESSIQSIGGGDAPPDDNGGLIVLG